ncbi:sulfoxide reductase heme-binding subunit YedZ [Ramlibacter sp. H39-3-26]|uniref:sulfite oxidase heme-binding subunit YedZ n=1 Tax=Curvibacter soli TaxID=3031331 RepID=UPI0023DCBC4F|nr:protein-methionine-sulfoxide reductase heme-binding subunit MsrQ [Ramlibacter sp. H39-3-26]MDF1483754.1 sulfoxide reductase heme-binding subunit YedZ [Ramlibacter sp. H39-3-26]
MNALLLRREAKPLVFVLCLLPFAWLLAGALTDGLGPNPAERLIRSTGDWTLRMLCIALAVTPLRVLAGWAALARYRRMLGLYVYFYAAWHLLCYAWFDMGFAWGDIVRDIAKRPFILVGFSAFVLLTPLAATSFNRAIRALGARRWRMLHRLVFAAAGLALLHFLWMRAGKNNFTEVGVYTAIVAVLVGWRLWRAIATRPATAPGYR